VFPFVMAALSDAVGLRGGFLFSLALNVALAGLSLALVGAARKRGVMSGSREP
jgi:hypothetical protein